jgi:hypothetical protein
MKTYRWRSWSGRVRTTEAASVEFKPDHVVFYGYEDEVLLSVSNNDVHDLHPDTEPDPKWWD